jgi:WD40 repeat protein
LVRAVGSDGYTSKYIVAATSGSALDTGLCSWDFDARSVAAYHWDSENQSNGVSQRKWYKPCGALIASAGTASKSLTLHDIRDGDTLMTWALKGHISSLDFSSPLQWMRKDKLVLAENYRALSLWDVNAMGGQPLRYIALPEESRICALHIHDVDDDCSTGIRRRY